MGNAQGMLNASISQSDEYDKKKNEELACDDGLNLNDTELSLTSDLVPGPPSRSKHSLRSFGGPHSPRCRGASLVHNFLLHYSYM